MLALDMLRGAAGAQPTLDLNFTSGTLDSRVTYTGASLATLTDATGAIAYKPHNLLTYSGDLSNAVWTKTLGASTTSGSVTIGTGAASEARYKIYLLTASKTFTASVQIAVASGTAKFRIKNTHGGVVDNYSSDLTATTTPQWFSLTVNNAASAGDGSQTVGIVNASDASSNGVTFLVTGAQLNLGPLQPYYPTTSAAYYGPRFTYDPVTHAALGLLIEEQRTNLLTYSEQFDNAAWSGVNVTVTKVAGAPDGSSNLNKVQATAAAATLIRQNATVAATAATFSVYVKQGSGATDGNAFILRNATTATILLSVTVNYSTGVVTYVTGSTGVTLTDVGGGMWRLVMTATSGITSGNDIQAYAFYPGNSETAGEYVYAWGAQLEAGAFATSYIPTTSASVTRAADSATMTGSNFSSWFNAAEGTFVVDGYIASSANSPGLVAVNPGGYGFNDTLKALWWNGTVNVQTANQMASVAILRKQAAAYSPGLTRVCLAGGTVASNASNGYLGTPTSLTIGSVGSGQFINAPISRLRYYNTALTNAQLQALTT